MSVKLVLNEGQMQNFYSSFINESLILQGSSDSEHSSNDSFHLSVYLELILLTGTFCDYILVVQRNRKIFLSCTMLILESRVLCTHLLRIR